MIETKEIFTGSQCNNNCVFCKYEKEQRKERDAAEIKNELREAKQHGIERIVFTGGNPLLRKDFNALLDYAHGLHFRWIGIATNGRDFFRAKLVRIDSENKYFDESIKKIIEKLNYFRILVCGADAAMHDAITRS